MTDDTRAFLPPLPDGAAHAWSKPVRSAAPHVRPPPPPGERRSFITPDDRLFHTRHLDPVEVDPGSWHLQLEGMVARPYALSLDGLRALPAATVTAFHECWGPPTRPNTTNLHRVGNVRWTGVPLRRLLDAAQPAPQARFVWSEGLDSGTFFDDPVDAYRKDLTLDKALREEVLVAYAMNGEPLDMMRGGPVRLVVPGWFGTNSTKWLTRLIVADHRAVGPFTTRWYNPEVAIGGRMRRMPVWEVSVNSMIVEPADGDRLEGPFRVRGWAWAADPVRDVEISLDGGAQWRAARVTPRTAFEWQAFDCDIAEAPAGRLSVMARATDTSGRTQPITGARNACPVVDVERTGC